MTPMNELDKKALEYHKEHKGKIGTNLLAPLDGKPDLSLAYSPGVGAVSLAISGDVNLAREMTLKGRTVAIISDGSAILGLGNLGAEPAIPVMEGKAALLKHFAGVDAFPICLNTQDPDEIINIVQNIAPVFGAINLEDISAPRCFYIEQTLREKLNIPVMHDDQWGTATVVLAGLTNALKLKNLKLSDAKIVISGLGSAGVAVSSLLFSAGAEHLTFIDSNGIVNKNRSDLNKEKLGLIEKSKATPGNGELVHAILGSDVFIGLSKPGVLTPEMIKSMNPDPIIFALANPIPEVMPDIAKLAGAYIIATGRSDFPNQVNNALVFPGIFKAALSVHGCQFTDEVFINCAYALANIVETPTVDYIIPSPFDENVVPAIYNSAREVFLKQINK
jgi:malate dehydrogenase (oxaloacetate-decarboxylating)